MVYLDLDQLKSLEPAELKKQRTHYLILKIWYYIHGYATLVCTEFIKNPSNEEIKIKVLEVATIFISDELDKKLMQVY